MSEKRVENPSNDLKERTEVMESPFPQLFGKYLLLEPFMDGGMATISLARHMGNMGENSPSADKLLAIKTIKQNWSTDEKFRQMFMDEIKILFGLNHPNIVQSYDYGMQNSQLFIAMEFIEGQNLRQFERKLREKRKWFTIDASLYIIAEICHALHYAHNYKSKLSGKDYRIVHRDVSPDNLMLTYDGQVKIIDFGIARATVKEDRTQTGLIKGKSSYIAPEYLRDQGDLSPLSDQFSTGLVLWELLTGRKCFNEKQEVDNLTKIVECQITDPQSYNPKVTRTLSKIVMKSLSRNPEDRFSSMDEFGKALTEVLNHEYSGFYPTKLKKYADVLFAEEIQELDERLRKFGNIDIDPYMEKLGKNSQGPTHSPSSPEANQSTETPDYDFQVIHGQKEFDTQKELTSQYTPKENNPPQTDSPTDHLSIVKDKPQKPESQPQAKQKPGLGLSSSVESQLHKSEAKEKDFTYEKEEAEKSRQWGSHLFRLFTYLGLAFFLLSMGALGDWYFRGENSFVGQFAKNWEQGDALFKDMGGKNPNLKQNQNKKFQESVKEQEKKIEKLKI